MDAYAEEFVARWPDLRGIRLDPRPGATAHEILAAVEVERPGLVAVGWPWLPGCLDDGDVAREILAHCRVRVLLVGRTRRTEPSLPRGGTAARSSIATWT